MDKTLKSEMYGQCDNKVYYYMVPLAPKNK